MGEENCWDDGGDGRLAIATTGERRRVQEPNLPNTPDARTKNPKRSSYDRRRQRKKSIDEKAAASRPP